MKLWTIQPIEVLEILEREGVYHTDEKLIDIPEFLPAYDWLCNYLQKKDKKPSGVNYPVWAWYRFMGREKKPDLRHSCFGQHGEQLVCIEIEIPDEKVLLSDFETWHFVLNNWWLDGSTCEEESDANDEWYKKLSKEEQEKVKVDSWERIFDIEPFDNEWIRKGYDVQAVFWELRKENVIKVQKFTAR